MLGRMFQVQNKRKERRYGRRTIARIYGKMAKKDRLIKGRIYYVEAKGFEKGHGNILLQLIGVKYMGRNSKGQLSFKHKGGVISKVYPRNVLYQKFMDR